MRLVKIIVVLLCTAAAVQAQHTFKARIVDNNTYDPVPGVEALIKNQVRAVSDEKGVLIITSIPEGKFEIEFKIPGYGAQKAAFTFPLPNPDRLYSIELVPTSRKLKPLMVSTTRSNRPAGEVPTKVEIIKTEQLDNQVHLSDGDLRYMLEGKSGIRIQQTSFSSFSSGIRIHGLYGRYTQVLRDGFPIYSGFSSSLSVLQISPLDLQQVEIIKGSNALYGDGGLSGLINLISRTPEDKKLTVLLKGSSALGLDVSAFYSQRFRKMGATLFASRNGNWAYDPAGISLTAVPEYERYTFNPGLFFYFNDKTQMSLSLNSMFENRQGGDTKYMKGEGDTLHAFFEKNVTDRISSQLVLTHRINDKSQFTVKNSIGFFKRRIEMPDYRFSGMQLSSYSEAAWQHSSQKLEWIVGVNEQTDRFTEDRIDAVVSRSYNYYTLGAFAQNIWNVARWFSVETGIRGDYHDEYGFFALPRLSTLFKISPKVSARLSAGMGYRAPTIFTDEAERIHYKNVLPVDPDKVDAEKSVGANFDLNYRTRVFGNQGWISIGQSVFYTRIYNPAELMETVAETYEFVKQDGYYDSKGTETNLQLRYQNYTFSLAYTFADVKQHFGGIVSEVPFSAKHHFNGIFSYEIIKNLRVGFEADFTGKQRLSDETKSRSYWICSITAEKEWRHISVFVNCHNILNVRQTKYEKIYTGTVTDPTFNDLYAPVDGVVAHLGIKVKL